MMEKIELLAPVGNRECLETALYFGADAVYLAGKSFGLRAFANNFSDEEIREAVEYTHGFCKKIYVAVNAVLYNAELPQLKDYLMFLAKTGVDGVIFSDPAVLYVVKQNKIDIPLHLSTQVNTTNYLSAAFWHAQGVERVVLSREMTLDDINALRNNCTNTLEIEAFVHGAMCIAHSGRCLLSAVTTGRSGNRGECAQPCRWEYYIHEKGYDGEYFNISQDERGTYLLNSKDLMMIEHIPELVAAGITSLKIEGRMKSAYYVASVVSAYRRAIDSYRLLGKDYEFDQNLKDELIKSATRGFTTGFFFGNPREDGQDMARDVVLRKYTFAAKVTDEAQNGYAVVEQRNKFSTGETLEVLSPDRNNLAFVVDEIVNMDGEDQQSAPHAQQKIKLKCPYALHRGDILRRHD